MSEAKAIEEVKTAVKKPKKKGRPSKNKDTTTVRLDKKIRNKINSLRGKETFDDFLTRLFDAPVVYAVKDHLFADIERARGAKIMADIGSSNSEPIGIYLYIGDSDEA